MKRLIISIALSIFCASTFAQTTAQSQSGSVASSQQQASVNGNTGNSLTLDTNSNADGAAHYSGTARILSNPGVSLGGAAAGFSNNNCANTQQVGLSGLRTSLGVGFAKESRSCNFRQNAATLYAAAGVRVANGQSTRAEALMDLADVQICRAMAELDATDMDNCKQLGVIGTREAAKTFQPVAMTTLPPPKPQAQNPATQTAFPTTDTVPVKTATLVVHP